MDRCIRPTSAIVDSVNSCYESVLKGYSLHSIEYNGQLISTGYTVAGYEDRDIIMNEPVCEQSI